MHRKHWKVCFAHLDASRSALTVSERRSAYFHDVRPIGELSDSAKRGHTRGAGSVAVYITRRRVCRVTMTYCQSNPDVVLVQIAQSTKTSKYRLVPLAASAIALKSIQRHDIHSRTTTRRILGVPEARSSLQEVLWSTKPISRQTEAAQSSKSCHRLGVVWWDVFLG